ncbi:uncharacterized protein LOC116292486 [Actinia tenebrosa]|uniref:Uncharacterized protein LOC116292486 n=1 Tax=Actinia tenebrosa TaxID=6105 RepID=A0A6P8HSQ6_ACTTE|nr:uncharacterized protein LOC116292486 [Actinia tenebrosa]
MATPKILSEEEIAGLLEDRRNGVGLQKAAKKYGIGIPKIRRIERENGLEVAIPEKPPTTDLQKHFLEVQDSFAIVLDDLQKAREELRDAKEELLAKMEQEEDSFEKIDVEEIENEVEEVSTKIDWQIAGNVLFAVAGIAAIVWARMQPPKVVYYRHPAEDTKPQRNSRIPEME